MSHLGTKGKERERLYSLKTSHNFFKVQNSWYVFRRTTRRSLCCNENVPRL